MTIIIFSISYTGMEKALKKSSENRILIDDASIPDWLLSEILQRLPVKHVFKFKSVSKRWLTIISDPYFAHLYTTRINNTLSLSTSQPWNLLFRCLYDVRIGPSSMTGTRIAFKQSHDFSSLGFSLNFLPFSEHDSPIKILASSNGLLLCCESFYWQKNYYICNPIMKQWIVLPIPTQTIESVAIGFISKADCYKLVRFPTADEGGSYLSLEIFSSETGKWHHSTVDCPISDYYIKIDTPVVHYNGRLHWLEFRRSKIITYDPEAETNNSQLDVMNLPDGKESEHLCLLGVSLGRLRYLEVTDACLGPRSVCVWVVSDYDARKWCLVYRIKFPDDDSWSGEGGKFVPPDKFYRFPVALHPHDFYTVYLIHSYCLVSYNLRTRKIEVLLQNFYSHQLLPFVFSPWPTTIPPQPK